MHPTTQHFINGKLTAGTGSRHGDIYNPALGEKIKEVSFAEVADIQAAVQAAKDAWPAWNNTPALKRARILFNFKALMLEHFDELVAMISEEHGKVINDAHGELVRGMEVVEFACGIPHLLKGEFSENVGTNINCHSMYQSLGVCVGITPFNFPAMVPMWMFPIAIACGNTFILKPSEKTPSVMIRLAELLTKAGLADGVFNVVHGDKIAVDSLITHPDVSAVSFVGSTPIAKYVYETATQHGKRVQALGGAKNHCVVMPDANFEKAVDGLMGAAFGSAGERCMAISVAVAVGEQTANMLKEKLQSRIQQLKVLPGNHKDAEMGPLVTQQHLEKVRSYIELGIEEGASLVIDGRNSNCVNENKKGFFLGASLFDNVNSEMRIYKEEIFGPVLCIVRADDLDSAIELINQHEFGNGTAIYTQNGAFANHFSSNIKVGMVGINVPVPVPMAFYSFGGWKNSLFGDMRVHGSEGIHFYTRLKTITSRWTMETSGASLEKSQGKSEYAMPTV